MKEIRIFYSNTSNPSEVFKTKNALRRGNFPFLDYYYNTPESADTQVDQLNTFYFDQLLEMGAPLSKPLDYVLMTTEEDGQPKLYIGETDILAAIQAQ